MTDETRQPPAETVSQARPQRGEFWVIEFHGKITVGHCYSAGMTTNLWEVVGRDILVDSTRSDFREVRKIDVEQLTAYQRPEPIQQPLTKEQAEDLTRRST